MSIEFRSQRVDSEKLHHLLFSFVPGRKNELLLLRMISKEGYFETRSSMLYTFSFEPDPTGIVKVSSFGLDKRFPINSNSFSFLLIDTTQFKIIENIVAKKKTLLYRLLRSKPRFNLHIVAVMIQANPTNWAKIRRKSSLFLFRPPLTFQN